MNLLITFIILNIINVILQTARSIITVRCGKVSAAIINAIAYGFYTVIVIYMVCDLNLWLKMLIVGGCNLVGVFVVKWIEEISRKDKIWKVEISVRRACAPALEDDLNHFEIPYSIVATTNNRWITFNCYCATQKESTFVHEMVQKFHAKYFVTETKSF